VQVTEVGGGKKMQISFACHFDAINTLIGVLLYFYTTIAVMDAIAQTIQTIGIILDGCFMAAVIMTWVLGKPVE